MQLFLLANLNPFQKFANFYFLVIGMLQCVKDITVSMGLPTTLPPLSFVLVIEAINDLYQDKQRKKADAIANGTRTQIFNRDTQTFEEKKWRDLKIGDVCKVSENEIIPADMLFLYSGAPGRPRSAFVNTKVCFREKSIGALCFIDTSPSLFAHNRVLMERPIINTVKLR
jgi:magnesium-transporting ATPase (P-type)